MSVIKARPNRVKSRSQIRRSSTGNPETGPDLSWASSPAVRRSMQSNRPRDTSFEVVVRSALHQAGYRFRKHARPVPDLRCEPDIVFTSRRVAVFLDGCYWHSCPEHATFPKTNESWWRAKLARNVERDRENDQELRRHGWKVVRIWEHESVGDAVKRIQLVLEP